MSTFQAFKLVYKAHFITASEIYGARQPNHPIRRRLNLKIIKKHNLPPSKITIKVLRQKIRIFNFLISKVKSTKPLVIQITKVVKSKSSRRISRRMNLSKLKRMLVTIRLLKNLRQQSNFCQHWPQI